jgi:predicted metal-dependent phosphoesterase TrpH
LGAVAVLAHPFLNLKEDQLREFLTEAVPCGLDAMEVLYSTYDEETTRLAEKIADEFGILHSGGSDYHGENKPHIQLGTGQGNLGICRTLAMSWTLKTS